MDNNGEYLNEWSFKTTESEISRHFAKLGSGPKKLAIEESSLAYWFSQLAYKYFDEILICDPRENALISRSAQKSDSADTYKLCRLLRLGELKRVYHPREDHRAIFKAAAQHYLDLTDDQIKIKQRLKAKYRTWGVPEVGGTTLYSKQGRKSYLNEVKSSVIKNQLSRFYHMLDNTIEQQEAAFHEMQRLGKRYPEINIDISFDNREIDMVEEGVDLVIRITRETDIKFAGRLLSSCRIPLVASPDYWKKHGKPEHPGELLSEFPQPGVVRNDEVLGCGVKDAHRLQEGCDDDGSGGMEGA